MTDEKLTPERVIRLLRATAGKLEAEVLAAADDDFVNLDDRTVDIALIAQLLADHIERSSTRMEWRCRDGVWTWKHLSDNGLVLNEGEGSS